MVHVCVGEVCGNFLAGLLWSESAGHGSLKTWLGSVFAFRSCDLIVSGQLAVPVACCSTHALKCLRHTSTRTKKKHAEILICFRFFISIRLFERSQRQLVELRPGGSLPFYTDAF